jgi:hypothetical protein
MLTVENWVPWLTQGYNVLLYELNNPYYNQNIILVPVGFIQISQISVFSARWWQMQHNFLPVKMLNSFCFVLKKSFEINNSFLNKINAWFSKSASKMIYNRNFKILWVCRDFKMNKPEQETIWSKSFKNSWNFPTLT